MILNLASGKVTEQRAIVNAIRDEREILPVDVNITVGAITVDCHEKAIDRMDNAILLWDNLGVTTLPWTMADNETEDLTKADLLEMQAAVITARGIRSLQLHGYASGVKAILPIADNSTEFDGDTWPY
tara:strand:- start:4130 stop:4513 length:384 start_codon:yes stop_codon:yes gene_type:complete